MIFIALLIVTTTIIMLWQFGVTKNPFVIFLVTAITIGFIAVIFNDNLHCPFVKKCPFSFCPLHK